MLLKKDDSKVFMQNIIDRFKVKQPAQDFRMPSLLILDLPIQITKTEGKKKSGLRYFNRKSWPKCLQIQLFKLKDKILENIFAILQKQNKN